MKKIIDTHVHTWNLAQLRLPWLDTEDYLNQTFTEKDYQKAAASDQFSITDAIYMEVDCTPSDREKENKWVLNQCANANSIFKSAVISGDLSDKHFKEYIEKYRFDISGLRQVLHVAEREKGFCLQPTFIQNVRYLGDLGLTFDLSLRNEELSDGYEMAKNCPETRIILNHMGNPNMEMLTQPLNDEKKSYREKWLGNLKKISELPNVYCKISGVMETEKASFEDFSEEIDQVMELFGEDRILYASNFPVIDLGGGLNKWTDFLLKLTESRSESFKGKLFRKNAQAVYFNLK
ncbi:amidohydrolase family protein [Enterococcus sp. DIV0187]|uniref:amidohydrolase family protein n=1 Tax=Enterococcus sp. DIV0187 TaxID=2774644 RepID=UPI003F243FB7